MHAPARWDIPGLPDGCEVADGGPLGADIALAFYRSYAELVAEGPALVRDLADHAMLWIAWPRRAAGHVATSPRTPCATSSSPSASST
ncbi:hypothetical protein ACGFY0_03910 [Streptomyces chartreusis]|uniref:hypothetical protein n=1 Tax=Streptomyces chartreusis TaxID=1969 RepID=UPI0037221666